MHYYQQASLISHPSILPASSRVPRMEGTLKWESRELKAIPISAATRVILGSSSHPHFFLLSKFLSVRVKDLDNVSERKAVSLVLVLQVLLTYKNLSCRLRKCSAVKEMSPFPALEQCFSDLSCHQDHLEGLLNYSLLGPRDSDSVGPGWSPRICISNKFLGDADVGLEMTLWESLL